MLHVKHLFLLLLMWERDLGKGRAIPSGLKPHVLTYQLSDLAVLLNISGSQTPSS